LESSRQGAHDSTITLNAPKRAISAYMTLYA
jgi:hypothetical protein